MRVNVAGAGITVGAWGFFGVVGYDGKERMKLNYKIFLRSRFEFYDDQVGSLAQMHSEWLFNELCSGELGNTTPWGRAFLALICAIIGLQVATRMCYAS